MARVVGIDLGTTNSLVAVMEKDRPRIIPGPDGARLLPSVIGLDDSGQIIVGSAARARLPLFPERTVAEAKRQMGSTERLKLGDRSYLPQELAGFLLKRLRDDASASLGAPVREAVVTVPAYFTDAQRQATRDAGQLAGLVVDRIINEPTAASLAYGLDRLEAEQHVLVYDLGGGTFDVSVLEMFAGVLEVRASTGDNRLGGTDFDRAIVDWLVARFQEQHGLSLATDVLALAQLKRAAEDAKITLSSATEVPIRLPALATKGSKQLGLELTLTRAQFEELVGARVRSTLGPIRAALKDANLDAKRIDEVVLVGGSSRMPLVRQILTEFFGKAPLAGVDPDEAVALGAAIQAGLKEGSLGNTGIMITDVAPYTLGVEVMTRTDSGTPLSGMFSPIIQRNSTIPISRTEVYRTTHDDQRAVQIRVFQGEDRFAKNNAFLDEYLVEGVPSGKAGVEAVAVTFTYDLNGILQVKTKVVSTGKEAVLMVDHSRGLTPLEREEARARLDREWKPSPSAPRPPTTATPAPTSDPDQQLLQVAHQKLTALGPGPNFDRLRAAVEALATATDSAAKLTASRSLTELLFDLDG
ncbi:MAG: Hsp70 family protein [Archangium sp.]